MPYRRSPTGLTIPEEDVDKLVEVGVNAVRDFEALADFRQSLKANSSVSQ